MELLATMLSWLIGSSTEEAEGVDDIQDDEFWEEIGGPESICKNPPYMEVALKRGGDFDFYY